MRRIKTPTKKRILIIVPLVIVIGAGIVFALEKRGTINLFGADTPTNEVAQTTSTTPTAQEDFTEGNEREAGNTNTENRGSGVVTDNQGAAPTDTSKPTVSNTGEITVYLPTSNTVVKQGQEVSGKSTLSKVSYRLIDDATGVISTGELNVVNGSFSGTLSFTTSASAGRLDIFGTRDDFSEFSNVNIPLRFK